MPKVNKIEYILNGRLHVGIDVVILAENTIMSIVIGIMYDNYSSTLMTVIWVCYLLGFVMKIIFYIGLHPWSELVRNDLKKTWEEWQRPIDGKGCWDQFKAGLRVEWNICYKTEPGMNVQISGK